MVHRTAPRQVMADRYFPVRVRVAVPPGGFGSQLNIMCGWLDRHAGKAGYFNGAETGAGLRDAVLFYFLDPKLAAAFVDHFACGLVIGRELPGSTVPYQS